MKTKIPPLFYWLIISSLLVLGIGAYLKYVVLAPLDLYKEEHLMAVPFLLMSDEQAQYALQNQTEPVQETEVTEPPTELTTEPETTAAPTEPTEETTEPPTEPTEPIPMDESWFDDALFIGDSRTQGLGAFGKLGKADFFAQVGMTVYGARSAEIEFKGYKNKQTIRSLLKRNEYGKVYICLGLNEIMGNHDDLIAAYQKIIDLVQEVEPDAVIILQAVMTVGREKAATKACFHPDYIASLNERIKALAVGENMRYIDVNEWIADEEGYLPDGWSRDGTHPYADGYYEWGEWIRLNASTLGID